MPPAEKKIPCAFNFAKSALPSPSEISDSSVCGCFCVKPTSRSSVEMKLIFQNVYQSSNTFFFVNERFGARIRNTQSKLQHLQLNNPAALKYECITKRYNMTAHWRSVDAVSDNYFEESSRAVALFSTYYFFGIFLSIWFGLATWIACL